KALKLKVDEIKERIDAYQIDINTLQNKLKFTREQELTINKENVKIEIDKFDLEIKKIDDKLERLIEPILEEVDSTELNTKLIEIKSKIQEAKKREKEELEIFEKQHNLEAAKIELKLKDINEKLAIKILIKENEKLVEYLEKQRFDLEQIKANNEKLLNRIKEYEELKISLVETNINQHFDLVQFKMFEYFDNGNYKDNCIIASKEGKEYVQMSNGEKIASGIDIIKTLGEKINVKVPLFIDNAESLTLPIPVSTQVVKLIADGNYKTLTVR
ncbi:MAG: hypothetical protein ACK5LY_05675, partial [Lachnospirales bacterium]